MDGARLDKLRVIDETVQVAVNYPANRRDTIPCPALQWIWLRVEL